MKKKLIPFIFGLGVMASLPFSTCVRAVDNDEQESGNVVYDTNIGFANTDTENSGSTTLTMTIPECTLTIPRDTTLRKGTLSANIGKITVNGHYFVKPYYVEVSATKSDFTNVGNNGQIVSNPKANQHILFDVATTTGTPSTAETTAAAETTFVKNGAIGLKGTNNDESDFTPTRACRRFWKNEKLLDSDSNADTEKDYKDGKVCDVNGNNNIWIRINRDQWEGKENNLSKTKPVGGKYKGSITFTAAFKEDYTSNMPVWKDIT